MSFLTKKVLQILLLCGIAMLFYTNLTGQVNCIIEDDMPYGDPIELDLLNEFISGPHLKNVFYIPNVEDPVKTIRVNLHVVQKSDGRDELIVTKKIVVQH